MWPASCGGSRQRPSGGMWRSAPGAPARSEEGRFAGRAPNEGYNERRKMANVTVRFFDDETLEGTARDLDFDEPDFLVEVDDSAGLENNETAWIPMTAVKWVELEEMDMLARLHRDGLLSDDEFASKRTQVLERL